MQDTFTNTLSGAEAHALGSALGMPTTDLRDILDAPHDDDCICDECTEKISDETGVEFVYEVTEAQENTVYYFHINKLLDELKELKFRNIYSEPDLAVYNWRGRNVTIKRFQCADNKEK